MGFCLLTLSCYHQLSCRIGCAVCFLKSYCKTNKFFFSCFYLYKKGGVIILLKASANCNWTLLLHPPAPPSYPNILPCRLVGRKLRVQVGSREVARCKNTGGRRPARVALVLYPSSIPQMASLADDLTSVRQGRELVRGLVASACLLGLVERKKEV